MVSRQAAGLCGHGAQPRPVVAPGDYRRFRTGGSWAADDFLDRTRPPGVRAFELRDRGVSEGDGVVGYLPNVAEAVIAFLATASVGATWSCCGQDYQPEAVIDRLGQLGPVVLVMADGYRFGGREVDRLWQLPALQAGMPTLREVLVVGRLHAGTSLPGHHAVGGCSQWGWGRNDSRARAFRPPTLGPVLLGYDREAEGGLFTATAESCSST